MKILAIMIFCSVSVYCQVFSPYSDTIEKNTVDKTIADSLFNLANSRLSFLDYDDCNNCTLRAHIMTFLFSKQFPRLKIGKVWLFADSKIESRKDYYRTHRKVYLSYKGMCSSWAFHVAPVLIFETDTLVIDPSTQDSAESLSEWVKNISSNTPSYIVIKESKYYMYPERNNDDLFDDNTADWDEIYEIGSFETEINFMAEKLTTAYHSFFDPIKFNYYKKKLSALTE